MSKQQISPSTRKEMDSFIHGNINAPHFCDFEDVNTLKQYSEEELKPIFGPCLASRITRRKHKRPLPLGAVCRRH